MATSVGQINFGVGIDASGIAAEINRALTPALATVQQELNRRPLEIKLEVDTRTAIKQLQRELALVRIPPIKVGLEIDTRTAVKQMQRELAAVRLNDLNTKVKIEVDLSDADLKKLRDAASAIRRLESKSVKVEIDVALSDADLKKLRDAASAIRRLESKSVKVEIDINLTEAQVQSLRQAAAAIRRLESKTVVIKVDIQVDEARLRALAELLRNLRDRNLRVGVSADNGPVDRLAASLGRLGAYTGIGAGIAAGLGVIVGAAGAAAGAIGGLAGALAALGPALAAIGGTLAVGLEGVGGAFSALSDMSANAASDARTQSEAVASAQDALASATDSAASAQDGLETALDSSADAAEAVADAYKTAQERLDGYTQSLKEASLDEREAALDLKDAQEALAKGGFKDADERERALLKVERAEISLAKAQKANKDLNEEATEAIEKGIDQADEVVAARKNQAAADKQVEAAQRNVAAAARAVATASENLTKAQSGSTASSEKFADALAKLSPNAQATVLAFKELQPALTQIRRDVQDNLFAGLGEELTQTADVVLPAFETGMEGISFQLNLAAKNALQFLRSAEGIQLINAAFLNGEALVKGLTSGTGELTKGFVDLTTTATPHMERLGGAIAGIGEGIGAAISSAAASGELDKAFEGLNIALEGLKPLMDGLVGSLITIASEVLPALGPLFKTFGDTLTAIAPSLGEIGKVFANSLTAILPSLGQLITSLVDGLVPIFPVLVQLIQTLFTAIEPLIEPFSQIAVIVGETLINTIKALEPALKPLADAFVSLLNVIAPILPLIATVISSLVEALAPALQVIFDALTPVIKLFAEQMKPVIEQLAPILAQVAMELGTAIASAIQELAPILPPLITAFANLFLAIAPLLPEIIQLAVQVLPPLVDIMLLIAPILIRLIELFTQFVQMTVQDAITGINLVTSAFEFMGNAIDSTVSWLTDTVFPALGDGIDWLVNAFDTGVSGIGEALDGLRSLAAVPINFVIDTVFNNGLLRAWGDIDNLLGGVLPDVPNIPKIPGFAVGGGISGKGSGTSDDILAWLSNGEHVVTAKEVMAAGGQNILYAIRDMIARGIPFTWDNGKIVTDLGRDNLNAYGAKVATAGVGNVPPEGLFDSLLPRFATGGQATLMPWMLQLQKGHEFAKAQHGKPYQWAGPSGIGSSFDCSGFMASIAAAILGDDPWRRYWATASFSGYPTVGPQGFTKGLKEGSGFGIGVTDDPGGPGGGHTAGALAGIPLLNIPEARVESGGSLGDVHYGMGTDPNSFASFYGLPIGANGFFQPSPGGSANGPSVGEQQSFLSKTIERMIQAAVDPVKDLVKAGGFVPPPAIKGIPTAVLDATPHFFAESAQKAVTGLGSLLGGAWQRAKDAGGLIGLGANVLDSLNPFDTGGIANGTGIMTKNTIEPERILSPEQTKLFEALVQALTSIAGAGLSAASTATQAVVVDISSASVDALAVTLGIDARKREEEGVETPQFLELAEDIQQVQITTGELFSDTTDLLERTATSQEEAAQIAADQQMSQLLDIANKLSVDVLGPILSSAVGAGTEFLTGVIDGLSKDVVTAVNGTTRAVNDIDTSDGGGTTTTSGLANFGAPGSSFDAASAVADAVGTIASAATAAFNKVRDDVIAAALAQKRSDVGEESRGLLGKDVSGGFLTDFIVQLTGVEIEVRDLLSDTLDEVRDFRGDSFSAFDEAGQLISDTAVLVDRNQSSIELAAAEAERIQKALIKAVLKYLIVNVLIPILTAVLAAMITIASTAIGAAIGSIIPVIGTAIGAIAGAAVGAALSGLAAVFVGLLAVGAGASIDAFDEGGIAGGIGFMPKNTIAPERVLSPRQTTAFETLVSVLDGRGTAGNRSVNVGSMNIYGQNAPAKSADTLLGLLNT